MAARSGGCSASPHMSSWSCQSSASPTWWPPSRIPPVDPDRAFIHRGGRAAYAVAVLSVLYAIVYLGFVRTDATNANAAAVSWALIALGALSAAFATAAVGAYVGGTIGNFISALGVAYALLSATHGVFSAIGDMQGF